MSEPLRIDERGAGELDALEPLWTAMVEHHREVAAGTVPVRGPAESWQLRRSEYVHWLAEGTGWLLVARLPDGTMQGYAFARRTTSGPTFDLGPVRGELESLVVRPDARGQGVGAALVEAAREKLRAEGCRYWAVSVMEANEGAVRLYERAGFRPWLRELASPL